MPFSFTTWAHKIYHNSITFAEKQYDDFDDHDELREHYGQEIGKYLFEDYIVEPQYNLLKEKLFEVVEDLLNYLDCYYSCVDEEDSDESLLNTLTEEEQEARERINPEIVFNECRGFCKTLKSRNTRFF